MNEAREPSRLFLVAHERSTAWTRNHYSDDAKLRARQRLWASQSPPFDLVGWTLDLVVLDDATRLLDLGCGNGAYLRRLREAGVPAVGCDLSFGILPVGEHAELVNADAMVLPFRGDSFDVVLAPHMLYHVPDLSKAVREIRRVLRRGGTLVAVSNGQNHIRSLTRLIEDSVREATPGWEMQSQATHGFSLENGHHALGASFSAVACVRPDSPPAVALTDPSLAAEYVASMGDGYEHEVNRPWDEVVEHVRRAVQDGIDSNGSFVVAGDPGAFVCT